MKLPLILASLLQKVRGLFHRPEEPLTYTPAPSLNEDLGGLTEPQLKEEIEVIERRLEINIIQPEGRDGLNYRKARLEAQLRSLKK